MQYFNLSISSEDASQPPARCATLLWTTVANLWTEKGSLQISLKGVARKKQSTMEHVRLTLANYKINQERAHSGDYIYVYVCIYTYVYCVTCRWQQMAWSQLTQWPYHQASQQDGWEHWTKKTLYFVKTHLRQLRQLRILKKASILTWHFLFLYCKDVSNELATSHNGRNPSFSRLLDLSFNPPGNFPQSHARAYFHISPLSRPSDNQSIQVSIYSLYILYILSATRLQQVEYTS